MGNLSSKKLYKSGSWSHYYCEEGKWHGPFLHWLTFDKTYQTFYGSGKDDIGEFTLTGSYDPSVKSIYMTQKYIKGTGNPSINQGHICLYQLHWDKKRRVFTGPMQVKHQGMTILTGYFEMWPN